MATPAETTDGVNKGVISTEKSYSCLLKELSGIHLKYSLVVPIWDMNGNMNVLFNGFKAEIGVHVRNSICYSIKWMTASSEAAANNKDMDVWKFVAFELQKLRRHIYKDPVLIRRSGGVVHEFGSTDHHILQQGPCF